MSEIYAVAGGHPFGCQLDIQPAIAYIYIYICIYIYVLYLLLSLFHSCACSKTSYSFFLNWMARWINYGWYAAWTDIDVWAIRSWVTRIIGLYSRTSVMNKLSFKCVFDLILFIRFSFSSQFFMHLFGFWFRCQLMGVNYTLPILVNRSMIWANKYWRKLTMYHIITYFRSNYN